MKDKMIIICDRIDASKENVDINLVGLASSDLFSLKN
jgi:hypothetical protein